MDVSFRHKAQTLLPVLAILCSGGVNGRADAIYTAINLGQVDPTANYLPALSAADQASFKAGSFDIFAHPPMVISVQEYQLAGSSTYIGPSEMVTSNNLGVNAGLSSIYYSAWGGAEGKVAVYGPEQTGSVNFVSTNSDLKYGQFYGNVAGINDHSILALNEYQYLTNNPNVTNPTPYLQGFGATGDYSKGLSLGSLGGTDGMANALEQCQPSCRLVPACQWCPARLSLLQRLDARSQSHGAASVGYCP